MESAKEIESESFEREASVTLEEDQSTRLEMDFFKSFFEDDPDEVHRSSLSKESIMDARHGLKSLLTYRHIVNDIPNQRRRKFKIEESKKERQRVLRNRLEQAIEVKDFKLSNKFERCMYDSSEVGLGSALLKEDYRSALLSKEKSVKTRVMHYRPATKMDSYPTVASSRTSDDTFLNTPTLEWDFKTSARRFLQFSRRPGSPMQENSTGTITTTRLDTISQSEILKEGKLRFKPPHHIESRLKRPTTSVPWLGNRLELSSLPVRFEIPIDVRDFDGMDIKTYLSKYCRIPKERKLSLMQVYNRHRSPRTHQMTCFELSRAIQEVLCDSLSEEVTMKFLRFLQMDKIGAHVELNIFSPIVAVAERILYLSFVESVGRPVLPGVVVSFLEVADFQCLNYKLGIIKIDARLRTLLFSLGS